MLVAPLAVAGSAQTAAGERLGDSDRGGPPLRRARRGRAGLRLDRGERRGGRRDLPAAGRAAAGHRAGGGAQPACCRPPALLARLEHRLPLLTGGAARPAGAAADDARRDRLEPRPADAGGAGAVPPPRRFRRWLHAGDGRGRRESRSRGVEESRRTTRSPRLRSTLSPRWSIRASSSWTSGPTVDRTPCPETSTGRNRALSGCWRRSASTGWSGWRRAARSRRCARRHAVSYLALAETAQRALSGPEQGRGSTGWTTEHDNLRAALDWGSPPGTARRALRLAGALCWYWFVRGHLTRDMACWSERWRRRRGAESGAGHGAEHGR